MHTFRDFPGLLCDALFLCVNASTPSPQCVILFRLYRTAVPHLEVRFASLAYYFRLLIWLPADLSEASIHLPVVSTPNQIDEKS